MKCFILISIYRRAAQALVGREFRGVCGAALKQTRTLNSGISIWRSNEHRASESAPSLFVCISLEVFQLTENHVQVRIVLIN